MKSYTDLEQSKKLAEILSPESADLEYMFSRKDNSMVTEVPFFKYESPGPDYYYDYVPAWSLAALISMLPKHIKYNGNKYYLRFEKDYIEYINNNVSITGQYLYAAVSVNNSLVDACYEMILKLNKKLEYGKRR